MQSKSFRETTTHSSSHLLHVLSVLLELPGGEAEEADTAERRTGAWKVTCLLQGRASDPPLLLSVTCAVCPCHHA